MDSPGSYSWTLLEGTSLTTQRPVVNTVELFLIWVPDSPYRDHDFGILDCWFLNSFASDDAGRRHQGLFRARLLNFGIWIFRLLLVRGRWRGDQGLCRTLHACLWNLYFWIPRSRRRLRGGQESFRTWLLDCWFVDVRTPFPRERQKGGSGNEYVYSEYTSTVLAIIVIPIWFRGY